MNAQAPAPPPAPWRALRIELAHLRVGAPPAENACALRWLTSADCAPPWSALARAGGSAFGLALLQRELAARSDADGLVLSVGPAVVRGLPTAARACVQAVSPLTGLYAEGQVGSDLGARLAACADAVLLVGRAPQRAGLLALEADGSVELIAGDDLAAAEPGAAEALARARLGELALLRCGPAAHSGIAYANLAAGGAQPSFVGRGGLGARLAGMGLCALALRARPREPAPLDERGRALLGWLSRSPRLLARARGGTLELLHAFAARGDLRGWQHALALPPEAGWELAREAAEAARGRHGCRGCPTPCGIEFERGDGSAQRAHFGASYALGPNLGLAHFADALELLARCDRAGVDAREAGACLAIWCRAQQLGRVPRARTSEREPVHEPEHEPARAGELGRAEPSDFGDARALGALLEDALAGRMPAARMRIGALALARELGLERELHAARGQAARPEQALAAVLGQCVSTGGSDPMRSFPFLAGGEVEPERALALLGWSAAPAGAFDPRAPSAKGRLVWWHENLSAALDASGFCAFSAAGLLSDGLCSLDELAAVVAPEACAGPTRGAARRWLASGASLVLARHALNAELAPRAGLEPPPWARAALEQPGMLGEYLLCRGLERDGSPSARAWAALGSERLADLPDELQPPPATQERAEAASGACGPSARFAATSAAAARGRVLLRCSGELGARLGDALALELALPASALEVLRAAARHSPASAALLFAEDRPLPAIFRAGERLADAASCRDGDVLDLVSVIGGG